MSKHDCCVFCPRHIKEMSVYVFQFFTSVFLGCKYILLGSLCSTLLEYMQHNTGSVYMKMSYLKQYWCWMVQFITERAKQSIVIKMNADVRKPQEFLYEITTVVRCWEYFLLQCFCSEKSINKALQQDVWYMENNMFGVFFPRTTEDKRNVLILFSLLISLFLGSIVCFSVYFSACTFHICILSINYIMQKLFDLEIFHPKWTLSLSTHPHVIPNQYAVIFSWKTTGESLHKTIQFNHAVWMIRQIFKLHSENIWLFRKKSNNCLKTILSVYIKYSIVLNIV